MSFQRMLMMAAREPRPYLPHPEDIFVLYVPRWQEVDDRAVIRDYGGNDHDLGLGGGYAWNADGSVEFSMSRASYAQSEEFTPVSRQDYTILADRDLVPLASTGGGATGVKLVWNVPNRQAAEICNYNYNRRFSIMSGGRFNYDMPMNDGWCAQTNTNYNGVAISDGTERRTWSQVVVNVYQRPNRIHQLWRTLRVVAVWRRELTDEEIEMAKRYLDTASLEDYMMSRL